MPPGSMQSLASRRVLSFLSPFTIRRTRRPLRPCVAQAKPSLISTQGRSTSTAKGPQHFRATRRHYSSRSSSNPKGNPPRNSGSPEPAHSLSARLRKLSREYGYTAIGVYLGLAVLDFPFCFLAVRYFGAERVAHLEHVVVEGAKNVLRVPFPALFEKAAEAEADSVIAESKDEAASAEAGDATIWTHLALAFVIHKSFIFLRVPLTAAVTPKVVKTLRGWGWDIGKRRPKAR